jgi:hypothetical protein
MVTSLLVYIFLKLIGMVSIWTEHFKKQVQEKII